jgi:hypothetical protein
MRRIFISHSTDPADENAKAYVEALAKGLEDARDNGQPQFDVFLDRHSLNGGDDWKNKIVNHLLYCHAAAIILSPKALESPFVQFEVSNLMARRERQKDFSVVPVIPWIEGTAATRDVFKKTIQDELGQGYWKATTFTASVDYVGPFTPPEALAELTKVFGMKPPPDDDAALARLEKELARYLKKVDQDAFEAAAKAGGFNPPAPGARPDEAAAAVARALLMLPMEAQYRALDEMRANLDDQLVTVFDLLAPSWVSPEAAIVLGRPLETRPPGCCAIVNGALATFTPGMYVRRARGRISRAAAKVLQLNGTVLATDALTDLRRRARALLRDQLPCPGDIDSPTYGQTLTKELERRAAIVPIVVAVLLSGETSLSLLIELSKTAEFKPIMFFGLCGGTLFSTADPAVLCLKPPLEIDQEDHASKLHEYIETLL